ISGSGRRAKRVRYRLDGEHDRVLAKWEQPARKALQAGVRVGISLLNSTHGIYDFELDDGPASSAGATQPTAVQEPQDHKNLLVEDVRLPGVADDPTELSDNPRQGRIETEGGERSEISSSIPPKPTRPSGKEGGDDGVAENKKDFIAAVAAPPSGTPLDEDFFSPDSPGKGWARKRRRRHRE
ncbi:unnamed protein product, partial [Scytosiphon promiscuus]